jgi:hypothetical protein
VRVLISYVPLLGCAVAMVVCVRLMGGRSKDETKPDASEIGELRDEVARLRAEVNASGDEPAVQE